MQLEALAAHAEQEAKRRKEKEEEERRRKEAQEAEEAARQAKEQQEEEERRRAQEQQEGPASGGTTGGASSSSQPPPFIPSYHRTARCYMVEQMLNALDDEHLEILRFLIATLRGRLDHERPFLPSVPEGMQLQ